MSFQSAGFFIFLMGTLLGYFVVPAKWKNPVLLFACWFFYACTGIQYLLLLIVMTMVSYVAARLMEAAKTPGACRAFFWVGMVVLFANLFFFKYYDLFGEQLATAFTQWGFSYIPPDRGIIVPLGISFYTFTLSGYLIDVSQKVHPAQRSFVKLSLFASFFPLVSSGPIERGERLMPQFDTPHPFVYENFCRGASRMLWGFFKKFVIANTLMDMVDRVFNNLTDYTGPYLLLAALLYMYQIYCDFSGYSDIAIGIAQLFGITVMENFKRPFAAHSFTELWQRWHISLTSWLRDYIFTPLSFALRRVPFRTLVSCFCLFIIFPISGIWHGASWPYLVFGVMNGAYMVIGKLTLKKRRKWAKTNPLYRSKTGKAVLQIIMVYLLFASCHVFFRAPSLSDAFYVYSHLFTGWLDALKNPGTVIATLKTMNIGRITGVLMFASITGVELVEWWASREKIGTGAWLRARTPAKRMVIYYLLLILLALFGAFGASSFIYFQF